MSDIIRLLPDYLANQIAAGEVVQRPASVVKELLENAIDAGATSIQLIVKDAGKQLIQVKDNGSGMSETDARMCFERHATSKIKQTEDLFNIRTMGFRGEAMASIAAVAQVEVKTKPHNEELGTQIIIEGSQIVKQEPLACEPGTTFSIKNLFFNVPARRNFLKSEKVEMKHILDEFQRVALGFPEIQFSMFQNDTEIYNLPAGKLSQRIVNMYLPSYREQLVPCKEATELIKVEGYIGKPEFAKRTRGEQFFFVNNRFIKNFNLHHAVMEAFEGLISEGSFPFYVINIEIDPHRIDINVHPTKTEIKFDDDRSMYGIIYAAVRKGLGAHNVVPSLDFDMDINHDVLTNRASSNLINSTRSENPYSSGSSNFKPSEYADPRTQSNQKQWERLYAFDAAALAQNSEPASVEQSSIKFQSVMNQSGASQENASAEGSNKLMQLHNTYIVSQVRSGLMLIDQQAAHERILFEKFEANLRNHAGASQQLLFPQKIELSPSDFALATELLEEFRAIGFELSNFGGTTLVVNGVPTELGSQSDEQTLLEGLLEQFKFNKSNLRLNNHESLARAMAKRSALKAGTRMNQEEMSSLINQLFGCQQAKYSLDGTATYTILDMDKLASLF
jgi:DNA mismatch repair protein MutL